MNNTLFVENLYWSVQKSEIIDDLFFLVRVCVCENTKVQDAADVILQKAATARCHQVKNEGDAIERQTREP